MAFHISLSKDRAILVMFCVMFLQELACRGGFAAATGYNQIVKELIKAKSADPDRDRLTVQGLEHVAIIMDGNRRWAQERGKPGAAGHQKGVKSLKRLVRYAGERKLKYLTVYAFSSENWQRAEDEVNYLLRLFNDVLKDEFQELAENRVRLRFIGQLASM
ncbi:MAG: di-trans,poly-cis-decaprenylcistransferase, partial [Candidatus Obscuribacterales bacterium]|nr:di-trans,poly-cis-decaprenylcistransferase [Candidatus Obscuribacterales bacterium]